MAQNTFLKKDTALAYVRANYGNLAEAELELPVPFIEHFRRIGFQAAKVLAETGNLGLLLDGLDTISEKVALALARHKGPLHLSGLRAISDATAIALSNHTGALHLDGLEHISDSAANALCAHKGWLSLNGLNSLSPAAAVSLAKHKDHLSLGGLKIISDAAADGLARMDGCRLSLHREVKEQVDIARRRLAK